MQQHQYFYDLPLSSQINIALNFISKYDFAFAYNYILTEEDKREINNIYYKRFQMILNEVETHEELYLALSVPLLQGMDENLLKVISSLPK